jgi:hypothetical protein
VKEAQTGSPNAWDGAALEALRLTTVKDSGGRKRKRKSSLSEPKIAGGAL